MVNSSPSADSDVAEDKALQYKITHVFCPLQLPDGDDHSLSNDHALSEVAYASACAYAEHVSGSQKSQWQHIVKMLHNFNDTMNFEALDESLVISQLLSMGEGDVLSYFIRAQNAAVIFRKYASETLAETFEVSSCVEAVMGTRGKLVCSYPGPAIAVPNEVFEDPLFVSELAHFLCRMNEDNLDAAPTTRKAGSTVAEERDTVHPRYITELLTGILRGVGRPADIQRITKRIGDDVVWNNSRLPWRRSSLWLIIRVAIQTTLKRNALNRNIYKSFMLFFMNELAQKALLHDMSNDVLQWTVAKISRRLKKLGKSAAEWLSITVLETCTSIRTLLDERWKQVQAIDAVSPCWAPSALDITADTQLSLLHSGHYISNVLSSIHSSPPSSTFTPEIRARATLEDFLTVDGAFFQAAHKHEPHLTLYDVEREVSLGIDRWVAGILTSDIDSASEKLELLAKGYSTAALQTYNFNPEDVSRMFLTVIELWIALDKLVTRQIPMLADYSPEVPTSLLECLLLRHPENLQQCHLASQYLRSRHAAAKDGWSVFSARADGNSFAVRYYNKSSSLQTLKSMILKDARATRATKLEQLQTSNALHAQLQEQAARSTHVLSSNGKHAEQRCGKCKLEKRIKEMTIEVHEWPLPTDSCRAAIVVFELKCPAAFNMWRSATFHALVDLCSSPREPTKPFIILEKCSDLSPYYTKHPKSRVTLASDTKPYTKSHYRKTRIPSTEQKVCLNSGLDFYCFDTNHSTRITDAFGSLDISSLCSYHLGHGPYQNLQKYLQDTAHTSNDVICSKVDCDKDLSMHEFIAFGHLRSGPSLQWLNILREIRANSLSFRRDEVHMLLAQAAGQVGPYSNNGEMVWHRELECSSFCSSLLTELESLVAAVSGNWLEGMTMNTVTLLVSRLLARSLSVEDGTDITHQAHQLLRTVRAETFSWVVELMVKLESTANENEKLDLQSRLRDTAAICRSTFHIVEVTQLLKTSGDLEILLSCAIIIQDNTPAKLDTLSEVSRLLIERDHHLSWKLWPQINDTIEKGNKGIDLAVKRVWPTYRQGSHWHRCGSASCSWFTSTTLKCAGQEPQKLHLDILYGSLLVDGKTVGKLPNTIQQHSHFTTIFPNLILDVTPSDMAGMEYGTRGLISGHRVYFRMAGDELIIRAKEQQCDDILELIPSSKLESDLPNVLVEDHAHWLNLTTRSIEVRPLAEMWQSSPDNWRIQFAPGRHSMKKGHTNLMDIRSTTWKMVSSRLEPLEIPRNLVITLTSGSDTSEVNVELPRYGLTFFINSHGELESRNLRDMVYDDTQSMGTMVGLVNRLVLRPKLNTADEQRCVLIPEGDVSFSRHGHHVRVLVDIHDSRHQRMNYQTYVIDTDMGCLTGNVSLANKLYRAYLHALSSNPCSVDPLTKRTGTEEALSILQSAACQSFTKIDHRDARLLRSIASLTTKREWYPPHLQHMQRVHWASLPVASQHHGLYLSCASIVEILQSLQPFLHDDHNSSSPVVDFPTREEHLLHRASLRAAALCPPEFREPLPGGNHDTTYNARDLLQPASGEVRAYGAALAIYSWSPHKPLVIDIYSVLEKVTQPVIGTKGKTISLCYSKDWLSPNLPDDWLPMYDRCRQSNMHQHRFQLLFSLPAMAYSSPHLDDIAHTLVAFAVVPQFKDENPPEHTSYVLSDKYMPEEQTVNTFLSSCTVSLKGSSKKSTKERLQRDATIATAKLTMQWPSRTLPPFDFLDHSLYDVGALTSKVRKLFASCHQNWELKMHLVHVRHILGQIPEVSPKKWSDYIFTTGTGRSLQTSHETTLFNLFGRPPPILPPSGVTLQIIAAPIQIPSASASEVLRQLIDAVRRRSTDSFQVKYADDLHLSEIRNSLCRNKSSSFPLALKHLDLFREHYAHSEQGYIQCLDILADSLGPKTKSDCAVNEAGQWPRLTPKALLSCIASTSRNKVPLLWRDCLISFAKFGLEYQRARRMLLLAMRHQFEDLCKEMENVGCDGWEAESHPDWLLIQLEGNFHIRAIQANVAGEMMAPRSGENTTLQLHMGEGKSSVIIPMAASALANGDQIVRVVVPKALTTQMFQLLVDRLGGLPNRRIYHLPFSRFHKFNQSDVNALFAILEECKHEGGILVAQPEHILSFKLMTVEKQLGQDKSTAAELLRTQQWLQSHARDILDECDEILHVRNQLVYTIGSQRPLEGFPERWTNVQQVLGLVKSLSASIQFCFPRGVEVEPRLIHGAFPRFRILHHDAGKELISRIAWDIMDGLLPNYSFGQASQHVRVAIFNFLTLLDVIPSEVRTVQNYTKGTRTWTGLLHLRGLLACGILLFTLKERRWRVDFGLAPWRTMLAVPYRAKDVPAPRAEFGQPDVAVALTCLSYYYEGLTQEQLVVCFERLLQQGDPMQEYETWVRELPLVPDALRHISGINTKSSEQWRDLLVPMFSCNKATIDFYLSQVVFPRDAQEFSFKLSCSSWDLAEERTHVVTGFSGTNDGRYLLPTSITQRDPDHQQGTNARVLACLLQPENGSYMKTSLIDGERRTAREFLQLVVDQKPEIRAILDVGAQVLELRNSEFASVWLEAKPDALAAIYFNEDDELTVLTRKGTTQLLLESSFAHRLDECVVYLDDAHTRGTDIKFPDGFRAAVTLGPKVTKDRLTQGCMRMRKLGNGHSVMFFAPLDVDRSIRTIASKTELEVIHTMDILQWAMAETCAEIESRASLWAQQGMDHALRYDSWSNFCNRDISSNELTRAWRQPDAKTLEELYSPASPRDLGMISMPDIRKRCIELGVFSLLDQNLDEEQEREVVHEVEREHQVERSQKETPALHQVSWGIREFIQGTFVSLPASFRAFASSVVCNIHPEDVPAWSQSLFVTSDFCKVVDSGNAGEYLRPVNWVLSRPSPSIPTLVILSPFEVNELLPEIRTSKHVHLHIYTPRTHKTLPSCDDLLLYSIPAVPPIWAAPTSLVDQLNLFAGQLYLRDYETYIRVCRFLCVYANDLGDEGYFEVQNDGFIEPAHRPLGVRRECSFQKSPLLFLRQLVERRRMGVRFTLTHMGKILDGHLLREEDFVN